MRCTIRLTCLALSRSSLKCPVLSCPVLLRPALPCPDLTRPSLTCHTLTCPDLTRSSLRCLTLPCPAPRPDLTCHARQVPTCRRAMRTASSGPRSVTARAAGAPTGTTWNRRAHARDEATPDAVRAYRCVRACRCVQIRRCVQMCTVGCTGSAASLESMRSKC